MIQRNKIQQRRVFQFRTGGWPGQGSLVFMPLNDSRSSFHQSAYLQLIPGDVISVPRKLLPTKDTSNNLSHGQSNDNIYVLRFLLKVDQSVNWTILKSVKVISLFLATMETRVHKNQLGCLLQCTFPHANSRNNDQAVKFGTQVGEFEIYTFDVRTALNLQRN